MSANRDAEFARVFERLKTIIEPYTKQFFIVDDQPTGYSVDMAPEGERDPTSWFAGVRVGKAYVSFYLMPVYVEPSLLDDVSPELRRRMQGKSCFNFRSIDDGLFAELAELTPVPPRRCRRAGAAAPVPPRRCRRAGAAAPVPPLRCSSNPDGPAFRAFTIRDRHISDSSGSKGAEDGHLARSELVPRS